MLHAQRTERLLKGVPLLAAVDVGAVAARLTEAGVLTADEDAAISAGISAGQPAEQGARLLVEAVLRRGADGYAALRGAVGEHDPDLMARIEGSELAPFMTAVIAGETTSSHRQRGRRSTAFVNSRDVPFFRPFICGQNAQLALNLV